MHLYEINQEIINCLVVDEETGEVTVDEAKLAELTMMRENKIESICCWIKNLTSEAKAIRAEELALAERRKSLEKKAESLTGYLQHILSGEKFSTAKCSVSYRTSTVVTLVDAVAKKWMRVKYEPDKAAIKDALKSGKKVKGAVLESKQNMIIK